MAIDLEKTTSIATTNAAADNSSHADSKTASQENITVEEFKISGDALASQIKGLIQRGNIRRIIIKNEEDHTLIEIPLTVGVIGGTIGAALFPVVAAVGVIGAMVAHLTVVIERQKSDEIGDTLGR
ncbi:MAG: DUF4342 domain-containing protein [Cyanobacteria bacterium J06648_10]